MDSAAAGIGDSRKRWTMRAIGHHAHTLGHLAHGRVLRCGCGPEHLPQTRFPGTESPDGFEAWTPLRRQHAGFVRSHFIYSDRCECSLR
ncbi:hypothetical protein [Brooklawnia cerclae]|uniref:Uncharacterized protein n=2 Tax=Brooklawnia cerclae TaxID=349934 RepID=A0ABX0SLK2_9ACTN|nr:hypothetical protein [Brooklawnia cerclae]